MISKIVRCKLARRALTHALFSARLFPKIVIHLYIAGEKLGQYADCFLEMHEATVSLGMPIAGKPNSHEDIFKENQTVKFPNIRLQEATQ